MPDVKVPTCFSGTIVSLPPISFCMDGATHQLHTITPNPIRLRATTEEAAKAIATFSETNTVVSACGNWVWGPECSHLAVYHAAPVKLDGGNQGRSIVISHTGSLPGYQQCSVVPEDAMILAIYTKVYGPDSAEACRQWIADNCDR